MGERVFEAVAEYVPGLTNVDGNDINGCHQAPHFDRIDLVFRREMQLCERECRSFGTSLTFPGRTRYLCV